MDRKFIVGILFISFAFAGNMAFAKNRHRRVARRGYSQAQQSQGIWGYYNSSSVRPGAVCNRADRDPVKCKVCAIYGEDHGSTQGMRAVAGVIETRVRSGRWGSNACDIVHAPGQFIGAWHRLPNNPTLISAMVSAAENSQANGYMGFRSYCRAGRNVRIGGNCYGTADATPFIVLDPTMTAEDVDLQSEANLQMAELPQDPDAG